MKSKKIKDTVCLSEWAMLAWYGTVVDAYSDQGVPVPEELENWEVTWKILDDGRLKISYNPPNGSEIAVFVAREDWSYNRSAPA